MNIYFYNPVYFEKWRWDTPDTTGIGGSETAALELSCRLANRGHKTICYVPLPDDAARGTMYRGTEWHDLTDADFSAPGLWIILRDARCIDQMSGVGQSIWLLCQDESPISINAERADKCERIIALCQWHKRHLEKNWSVVKGKVCVSSNGIKANLVRETEGYDTLRNHRRLIFASSPDRGLLPLCKIFRRAREFVPDLALDIFYGTDNMEKLADRIPRFRHLVGDLKAAAHQPGVTWHGRVNQSQLYQEMMSSGIWCYPNTFTETSCIQCMEQQALGCIPITRPLAALAENVQHGVFIDGDPNEPLIQARYVSAIVKVAQSPEGQERIRTPMMQWAREHFDWERIVDQFESWMPEEVNV